MDRRSFLTGLLRGVVPRDDNATGHGPPRVLLRPGEALNTAGNPFGAAATSLAWVDISGPAPDQRAVVVAGHADGSLSSIELVHGASGWRHEVASHRNQRLNLGSGGAGSIACAVATPWRSVLCGGERGVVEVDAWTGTAARRPLFDGVRARAIRLSAVSGRPVEALVWGPDGALKFVSETVFSARNASANAAALERGTMAQAESQGGEPVTLKGQFLIASDGALCART
jgi:hypothetical protein